MIEYSNIIIRPNTSDAQILKCVFGLNEYKLDQLNEDMVIVDIGAHIGSFSMKSYNMGARNIFAFEANFENFLTLKQNVEKWGILAYHKAVRGNYKRKKMGSQLGENILNPSIRNMGGIVVGDDGDIDVITLNDIIKLVGGKIDILKLDCEGSEYSIIYESPPMVYKKIKNIIGEFHPGDVPTNMCENFINDSKNLENYLISMGYSTKFISSRLNNNYGHFYCTKQ